MFDPIEYNHLIQSVLDEFHGAFVTSDAERHYVIWPLQGNPVIATGKSPQKAWKNAAALIKKHKKEIDKVKKRIKDKVKLQEGPFWG